MHCKRVGSVSRMCVTKPQKHMFFIWKCFTQNHVCLVQNTNLIKILSCFAFENANFCVIVRVSVCVQPCTHSAHTYLAGIKQKMPKKQTAPFFWPTTRDHTFSVLHLAKKTKHIFGHELVVCQMCRVPLHTRGCQDFGLGHQILPCIVPGFGWICRGLSKMCQKVALDGHQKKQKTLLSRNLSQSVVALQEGHQGVGKPMLVLKGHSEDNFPPWVVG